MNDGMQVRFRRLQATEWEKLRDIRLEMLEDTPTGYLESLDSARAQSDRQWQDRAAGMVAPGSVALVADQGVDGSRLRALMRVAVNLPQDAARPRLAKLLSVYVAPELRGSGLADEMLRLAVAVARDELGAGLLQLGVHGGNGRARQFYLRNGFLDTGLRSPYPLDPASSEIFLEREL